MGKNSHLNAKSLVEKTKTEDEFIQAEAEPEPQAANKQQTVLL